MKDNLKEWAVIIILVVLTWSIVKPVLIDTRNLNQIAQFMNRQAQDITRLSGDVERLKKDVDGLKIK